MATDNVALYIGTWNVQWMSGEVPFVQENCQMLIGTGTQGASAPFLSPGFDVCVGFALLAVDGTPIITTEDGDDQPLILVLSHGTLRGAGYYQKRPFRIYISLAEAQLVNGQTYLSLYASTYIGDPDQVGVWGADGNPQPTLSVTAATPGPVLG
jgi:hypothetical protein